MQTFILAQHPPTPTGTVIRVEAQATTHAIPQLEELLGKTLTSIGGGKWTDGDKTYHLYFGIQALTQFAEILQLQTPMNLKDLMNQFVADAGILIQQTTTGDIHCKTCHALADQYDLWDDECR